MEEGINHYIKITNYNQLDAYVYIYMYEGPSGQIMHVLAAQYILYFKYLF